MKRSLAVAVVATLSILCSCSDDSPGPGAGAQSSTTDGGSAPGVDCAHPGAGDPLDDGRCACAPSRDVTGEWATSRTCREGDACRARNKEETLVLSQDGATVTGSRGDGYAITGTLCGDVLVWSGGPKDGLNPECGQIRFAEDDRYVTDSCYVASGDCARTFGEGCPSQKGQCTGTGARAPEAAPAIQKVVCN